jgi:hypothetical protein
MYCPSCGSPNKAEVKFCTTCGTNLLAVARALTEKPPDSNLIDERVAKVLKEYYRGRRETITGIVLIPSALKAMVLLALIGLPLVGSFFVVSWMLFWGIWALAVGLGKWIGSKGELTALGYTPPGGSLAHRLQTFFSSARKPIDVIALPANQHASRPVPASITESTTSHLDDPASSGPLNRTTPQT